MKLYQEPTEVARFGRRIARMRIDAGDDAVTAAGITGLCQAERVEMLTVRIPTDRLRLVQDLEAVGFQLMDCLVYYEAEIVSVVAPEPRGFTLREIADGDTEQVCEVAGVCFSEYFSHYHADRRFDRVKIAEGFIDWARRSCIDRTVAATVFLAVADGRIAGFATMRRNSEAEGEGVLFGVHPDFAGLGIYGALIERGKQWCQDNGMDRMIVSTQLDNLRVQRSWCNRGFRMFQSFFTFHKWFV